MSQRKCLFCEDVYDLDELKEMGEKYWHTKTQFVCPDCYDNLRRLPLEEQLKALLSPKWCNHYDCWASDAKDITDGMGDCDYDCYDCEDCEEVVARD